jgi:tRNA nucleotidyltransferase/poly(A) polymerase
MDDLSERLIGWLTAEGVKAYLVGGYVRDRLLGRPIYDIDVAIDGDTLSLGRQAADALGGAFYVLDEIRGTARLLVRTDDGAKEIDFARLKDGDLQADLAERDFTINAMALALADRGAAHVIDPHGGRADLHEKRLRAVAATSIADDPIRILRAVRLCGELALDLDPATDRLMRDAAPLLHRVSAERIRDELSRILSLPDLAGPLRYMHETSILWLLVERFGVAAPDLSVRSRRFDRAVDILTILGDLLDRPHDLGRPYDARVAPYHSRLQAHLEVHVADRRSRRLLLTFAALLQPLLEAEAAGVEAILTGLHFSNTEIRRGRTLCDARNAWPALGDVTSGELHRFYRLAGNAGPDAVAWRLAGSLTETRRGAETRRAAAESRVAYRAWRAYFDEYATVVVPPRLIDGNTLLTYFDLQPGPQLRALLDGVSEAQAEGRVNSFEEALRWVEHLLASRG